MPKDVKDSKVAPKDGAKPYPESTRRRAKKLKAQTAQAQEPIPAEIEEEQPVNDTESSAPIQPANQKQKKGTGKKTKVFATKDSMLSLIDEVASKETERSQGKLKRRAEIEDKAEQRELATLEAKAKKQNKLEMVKAQLKQKKRIQQREKKREKKNAHKENNHRSQEKVTKEHSFVSYYLD
ncbi:hypothetical protein Unana1_08494 [Umbelopsis nana]